MNKTEIGRRKPGRIFHRHRDGFCLSIGEGHGHGDVILHAFGAKVRQDGKFAVLFCPVPALYTAQSIKYAAKRAVPEHFALGDVVRDVEAAHFTIILEPRVIRCRQKGVKLAYDNADPLYRNAALAKVLDQPSHQFAGRCGFPRLAYYPIDKWVLATGRLVFFTLEDSDVVLKLGIDPVLIEGIVIIHLGS